MKHFLSLFVLLLLFFGARPAFAIEENMPATAIYAALTQNPDWLNTARPLKTDDLKGRILLVDFWTYCCINCIHVIPKLQEMEHEFGPQLTVIGVHSAKFATEGDTLHIREAVQKYGIEHPVVNDADFRIWNAFGVNAWPTVLLIGPNGLLKNVYKGEGDIDEMRADIQKLIAKSGDKLVTAALPLSLEKNKIPPTVLRFPTKLAANGNDLMISDSGHQQIKIVDSTTGKITGVIGSGEKGFKDGSFNEAQFKDPQGVLSDGEEIFVADTGNHRIRLIDLKNKTVSTIAGTGERGGYRLFGSGDALKTALASPWDLAFYPDKNTIVIANAGTHQLWKYNRKDKTLAIMAGSGQENIADGGASDAALAQTSGLSDDGHRLYFVDAETSSLRTYDGDKVTTLIGTGLFDFGLKDGKKGVALLQHPLGLYAEGGNEKSERIYVADTYNNVIRLFKNGTLTTLPIKGLNEPNSIIRQGDIFYIADTNNHRIVKMSADGKDRGALDVMPMEKPVRFQENLPNALTLPPQIIAPGAALKIGLPEQWHINKDAPNYLAVFKESHENVAQVAKSEIEKREIALHLDKGNYIVQGILYYCENTAGSQCLIRGVNIPVQVKNDGKKTVTLDLPIK